MSENDTGRVVGVHLDEAHYEFLCHLAQGWDMSPSDVLGAVCVQALNNAAANLKKMAAKKEEKPDVQDS